MSNASETSSSADTQIETRLILAGFITAVGIAVLVLVVALVREKWFADKPATYTPFLVFMPIVGAAIAFFLAVNPLPITLPPLAEKPDKADPGFADWRREQDHRFRYLNDRRSWQQRWWLGLGALALLLAVFITFDLGRQARRIYVYDQFALALPIGGAVSPQLQTATSVGAITDRRGARVTSDAKSSVAISRDQPGVQALFVWWVERQRKSLPEGALPMLLGGLFICAFGVWFPHLSLSETKGTLGVSEKLVAPILSLALVALGASQQAGAAKDEKNMELASRGLPAAVGLSREERITHTEQTQERLIALQPAGLSPESAKYLGDKLDNISERLDAGGAKELKLVGAIEGINERLLQVQDVLSHPTSAPPSMSPEDLKAIQKALTDLDDKAGVSLTAAAADHSGGCTLLGLEIEQAKPQIVAFEKKAEEQDQARVEFLKQPFWKRIGKATPPDGSADHWRAADLTKAQGAAGLRLRALCAPATQTSSR